MSVRNIIRDKHGSAKEEFCNLDREEVLWATWCAIQALADSGIDVGATATTIIRKKEAIDHKYNR
ncbi:MAG: hypothetical protein DRI65_14590 [Chloroflexota bacterium]|nr:MAG: hypothetical protein DRI65_14590 [Chloroflexota bacterium]